MKEVPALTLVMVCTIAFLCGRFWQQGSQELPEPQLDLLDPQASGEVTKRVLRSEVATQPAVRAIDPLDTSQLERFMLETSGLLKARPPVTPGLSGDDFMHAIPFQILSWFPRIVVYPAFADAARCDHIIKLASKYMYPSGLAYRPGEHHDDNQQTRTSSGTFLSSDQDPDGVLSWVEHRIAAVTRIPVANGEAFNVLKYQNMQHYDSHMDSFDPKFFGNQPSQRVATVLLYLSDPVEGGETVFKKEGVEGDARPIADWRSCDDGSFKYMPRKGDAVLFWSVDPDQQINPRALHGGCPVKAGTKWAMTKWLRSMSGNKNYDHAPGNEAQG